jgi:hypothetical protein
MTAEFLRDAAATAAVFGVFAAMVSIVSALLWP